MARPTAVARAAGDDPREQLVGMFDALHTAARRDGYHGCAFINTRRRVRHRQRRALPHRGAQARRPRWVTDLARRAGAADPEQLGRQLTLLIDGGLAASVLDADPAAPAAAKAVARVLVDAACPAGRGVAPRLNAGGRRRHLP
jgi:hypothetical protein